MEWCSLAVVKNFHLTAQWEGNKLSRHTISFLYFVQVTRHTHTPPMALLIIYDPLPNFQSTPGNHSQHTNCYGTVIENDWCSLFENHSAYQRPLQNQTTTITLIKMCFPLVIIHISFWCGYGITISSEVLLTKAAIHRYHLHCAVLNCAKNGYPLPQIINTHLTFLRVHLDKLPKSMTL